jgi:hypothetical protein
MVYAPPRILASVRVLAGDSTIITGLPDGAGSDCFVRVDAPFVRLVRVVRVLFAIAVSQISTGKQFT